MTLIDTAVLAEDFVAPTDLGSVAVSPTVPAPVSGFAALGLSDTVLRAVTELGFTSPTEVQLQVIPLAMPRAAEGDRLAIAAADLMVSSQTGSGKTAAFLIPLIEALLVRAAQAPKGASAHPMRKPSSVRFQATRPVALVLCPTRELAQQVAQDAIDLVRHCRGIRVASVIGGVPYQVQVARLQNADLVVATPGRLLDLQRAGHLVLDDVKHLVLDEGDRMLDLGFSDDLEEIHRLCAGRNQTLMFSATFAPRIQALGARLMKSPQRISVGSPQERHEGIEQVLFWADHAQHKRQLLEHWLRDVSINQAIVFASTQIECDDLAQDLQQSGYSAVALHGALSQGLRQRRLKALRDGQVQFLVATDVAARGIDVPTITHVFNFGLPMKAEDYTHRIGRTGRAGRQGLAVTLAEPRDFRRIRDIEAFTRQSLPVKTIEGMEPRRQPPAGVGGMSDRKPHGARSHAPARRPHADGASRFDSRPEPRGFGRSDDRRERGSGDRQWAAGARGEGAPMAGRPARGPKVVGATSGGRRPR
jgi:superfamily II DNA/RNA helicase